MNPDERIEFLRNELLACSAKIARLEQERAEAAQTLQLAGTAGREILANLERIGAALPDWPDYSNAKMLNEKLVWLTGKFNLSRSFRLFAVQPENFRDSASFKNEIWFRYLACLGLDSMRQILETIKQTEQSRHWLPKEARPCFSHMQSFRPYFYTVIQCLDSIAEVPLPVLSEIFRQNVANGPDFKEDAAAREDTAKGEKPAGPEWNFPQLLRECRLIGDSLAREIIEANRRMQIYCAMALAVFPDAGHQYWERVYRPHGSGDPG